MTKLENAKAKAIAVGWSEKLMNEVLNLEHSAASLNLECHVLNDASYEQNKAIFDLHNLVKGKMLGIFKASQK